MIKLKNLKPYTPEDPKFGSMVAYLQDDAGLDWYEAQKLFRPDTLKVATDNNGIIVAFEYDVSMLTPPDNFNVTEIPADEVPDDLENDGTWQIDTADKITKRILSGQEAIRVAEIEQKQRLNAVTALIDPLFDAVDLGIATADEKQRYDELRKYRVLLSRVDISKAPDIDWPEVP
ncbi:tail fiber assembly protein [Limnobaculum xujianqingii]|uniref:tail fiber assembly protein n=1 Tax=Limnobaculum xujianqingii TaxID=2738837 RepID=UPI0015E7EA1C|nr:tail fiber assembly protein [Limnobaculum xujianqingii]